jgi:hypothetical protein
MLHFGTTIRHWLIALLLGAFSFQALAASASELCRFQCQKDWKTNAASFGDSLGDSTPKWSLDSVPCPNAVPGDRSANSAEQDACTACGLCALNTVFAVQQVHATMDVKHPPLQTPAEAHALAWVGDPLFRPPRNQTHPV